MIWINSVKLRGISFWSSCSTKLHRSYSPDAFHEIVIAEAGLASLFCGFVCGYYSCKLGIIGLFGIKEELLFEKRNRGFDALALNFCFLILYLRIFVRLLV